MKSFSSSCGTSTGWRLYLPHLYSLSVPSCTLALIKLMEQNRSYATDQVEDLNLKIKAAAEKLGPRTGPHLKVVETYPASEASGKGKGKNLNRTVEDQDTDLSKLARDR